MPICEHCHHEMNKTGAVLQCACNHSICKDCLKLDFGGAMRSLMRAHERKG